jgi:plastocyanin
MQALSFAPAELHVAPGTTVTWTNDSSVGHTVTADDNAYDSGNVDPGGTFTMTFDTPGSYQYYCVPHGAPGLHGMAGVIIVDPDS